MREQIMTIEEVVGLLRVDADTVIGFLESGELNGLKLNNQWRVRETDLALFLHKKVETQSFKQTVKKLSDPKWWVKTFKTEAPDLLKQIESTDFQDGTFGAWLKKELGSDR